MITWEHKKLPYVDSSHWFGCISIVCSDWQWLSRSQAKIFPILCQPENLLLDMPWIERRAFYMQSMFPTPELWAQYFSPMLTSPLHFAASVSGLVNKQVPIWRTLILFADMHEYTVKVFH